MIGEEKGGNTLWVDFMAEVKQKLF
jgi:hypothetical protein